MQILTQSLNFPDACHLHPTHPAHLPLRQTRGWALALPTPSSGLALRHTSTPSAPRCRTCTSWPVGSVPVPVAQQTYLTLAYDNLFSGKQSPASFLAISKSSIQSSKMFSLPPPLSQPHLFPPSSANSVGKALQSFFFCFIFSQLSAGLPAHPLPRALRDRHNGTACRPADTLGSGTRPPAGLMIS